jgi:hypothetical protein
MIMIVAGVWVDFGSQRRYGEMATPERIMAEL